MDKGSSRLGLFLEREEEPAKCWEGEARAGGGATAPWVSTLAAPAGLGRSRFRGWQGPQPGRVGSRENRRGMWTQMNKVSSFRRCGCQGPWRNGAVLRKKWAHREKRSSLVAQNPWPGNFHMLQARPKKGEREMNDGNDSKERENLLRKGR